MNFYEKTNKQNMIAAHRGYRALYPENTLLAFEKAVGVFDFIEIDIQPARDGTLMVLHDDTMERTTDIAMRVPTPRPHRIADYDLVMLRSCDATGWFTRTDPFGSIASERISIDVIGPEPIPTLDEVLTLCAHHRMPLNIEVKDSPCTETDTLLVSLLKSLSPFRDDPFPLIISSFNHRYLARLRELDTTLDLAASVEHTHPPHLLTYLQDLGVVGYHVDAPLIESTPVNELAEVGITCGAFTLNDPIQQKACFDQGFRMVFADMTAEVYHALQEADTQ